MSDLNFKPVTGPGSAGGRSVPVPALDTGAAGATSGRDDGQARRQRRRSFLRFPADPDFRLFRVH
jgi:hypothetical protein